MTDKWFWNSLCLALGLLVACDSETRNEPAPGQMCRELVKECRGLETRFAKNCFAAGIAGREDPANEDQCFASYPRCIDECVFLSGVRPTGGDAGQAPDASAEADGGGSLDSGSPDGGAAPAEAGTPDAG